MSFDSPNRLPAAPASEHDLMLTTEEAAEILGVSPRALELWRQKKSQPLPYVRVGNLVRYRHKDLMAYIEARVVEP